MIVSEERLREIASAQLDDFSFVDAMNALIDIADCIEHEIPDEVLVRAARSHLEAAGAGSRVDPCRLLREMGGVAGGRGVGLPGQREIGQTRS